MAYETILTEVQNSVLVITLNREDKLNALNKTVFDELTLAIDELYTNHTLKGAVITGKGTRAFAAGADISEFTGLDAEGARKLAKRGQDLFFRLERSPKPIVAAVNGFALGGGCELAMACHMRISGETAKFGQPEVNLGIIPGYGGTQRMTQLVGKGRAFELLMTGKMINGAEAYRIGLVNQLGHNDTLVDTAIEIIESIAAKAPLAIGYVVDSINAVFEDGVDGYQTEIDGFAACTLTSDFKEGASAFLEKRKANFQGK